MTKYDSLRLWAARSALENGLATDLSVVSPFCLSPHSKGVLLNVSLTRANSTTGLTQSPLANPFKVKDFGGRGKTLPHYRHWLWERIQAGDEAVLDALKAIDDRTVLICWCKPGPCHGDVVKAAAEWLRDRAA